MNLELRGNKWITDTTSLCTCSLNCIKVWGVAPYVALLFQEFPLKFPHILSTLIFVYCYLELSRLCFFATGARKLMGSGDREVFSDRNKEPHICDSYHSCLSKATPPVVSACFV